MTDSQRGDSSVACPATCEAIWEQEEMGAIGCPLCGRSAESHPSEEGDDA